MKSSYLIKFFAVFAVFVGIAVAQAQPIAEIFPQKAHPGLAKLKKSGELEKFISQQITDYYQRRGKNFETISLTDLLERKNPYLLKANGYDTPSSLANALLSAHSSSREETLFGEVLENIAIYIAEQLYAGRKSAVEGIDLELERDGTRFLISVKSGVNWGNSSSRKATVGYFERARRIHATNNRNDGRLITMVGCCYGITPTEYRDVYYQISGARFWHFLTGESAFYIELIEIIGQQSNLLAEEYKSKVFAAKKRLSGELQKDYTEADGSIDWQKIVEINSAPHSNNQLPRAEKTSE